MSAVVVYHRSYGCDTGCCGHVVEIDGERVGLFEFSHPNAATDDFRAWAEELVRDVCAKEGVEDVDAHVADLDWDNCVVLDD